MDASRSQTTMVVLARGSAFMAAILVGFVSLVWRSDGAIWLKLAATVGLIAVVIARSIRLTMASRHYGNPKK